MDEDAATAAGQLFGDGPAGLLVVDHRELLSSTARVVGAQLGELHFKVWMALVTLHVATGQPENGAGETSVGELARIIWGARTHPGGSQTREILKALTGLDNAKFTLPGYHGIKQRAAPGITRTSLFSELYIDGTLLRAFQEQGQHGMNLTDFGREHGGKGRGTIAWKLHERYRDRLADSELRRFDWAKAQQLRGVALTLWMLFSSARVPYRPVFGSEEGLEMVEVPLTLEHCQALGVRAGTDAARRRTFNQAGPRVCGADHVFWSFEAHGGRGRDSFLRVVREKQQDSPLVAAFPDGQLELSRAA